MTDNEIIKALECCIYHHGKCTSCPLYAEVTTVCKEKKDNYVLDLINRQNAENDRLKKEVEDKERAYNDEFCLRKEYQSKCREFLKEKQTTKSEAIKEFAEKLKEYSFLDNLSLDGKETVYVDDIDNLVKEMTEELE